jgi:CheY-like chemotaxis protein
MNILLVEDNLADARLVEEAIRGSRGVHQVWLVQDGVAALAFLRREAPYTTVPRPDLILLDLNLPRKDGREVLAEVKADPALRAIPVITLTSTQTDAEVRRAYEHGVAAYCVKPDDLDGHMSLIQIIVELWGKRARLATGR